MRGSRRAVLIVSAVLTAATATTATVLVIEASDSPYLPSVVMFVWTAVFRLRVGQRAPG
jgi:hypothetical protein